MEVVVPLKYLSNFWRSLDLPLINCQIGIDLSWSEECIVSEISITPEIAGNPNARPPVQAIQEKQYKHVEHYSKQIVLNLMFQLLCCL